MKELTVKKEMFDFEKFRDDTLEFIDKMTNDGIDPITGIICIDDFGSCCGWMEEGRNKQSLDEELENKQKLFFPFIDPVIENKCNCSDGEERTISVEEKILGDLSQIGFLLSKSDDKFKIESSVLNPPIHCGCAPTMDKFESSPIFTDAMTNYLKKYIIE